MYFAGATVAGSLQTPNEDWFATASDLIVMLDSATIRTETGCAHGATWYARKLGAAVISGAARKSTPLIDVLANAIVEVAGLHRAECDLTHPGTPSAAIAIVRIEDEMLRYLVLGNITIVIDTTKSLEVLSDQRVNSTAAAERQEANRHLIGSAEKVASLLAMKHAELAVRNRPGGYWIAAADPTAASHSRTGGVPRGSVYRLAVLTDGAARAVDMFQLYESWRSALDALAELGGQEFIRKVRRMEASDPLGACFRRNTVSDDATVMLARSLSGGAEPKLAQARPPLRPYKERIKLANEILARTKGAYGDGSSQRARDERRNTESSQKGNYPLCCTTPSAPSTPGDSNVDLI